MTITIGRTLLAAITTIVLSSSVSSAHTLEAKTDPPRHSVISKDSLHIDLKDINKALHGLDSALKSFKGKHFAFHMDSSSVGPFHTPEMKMGPIDIPEWNVHVPEIKIPSIDMPKIEIPKIDEDISIGDGEI